MSNSGPDRSALETVAEWAHAEEGVTVDDTGAVVVDGNPPIVLEVTADDERVVVTHRRTEDPADTARIEAARQALPGRGASVQGSVSADDRSMTVTLSGTVYIDGMTRQGFVAMLNDVIAAADRVAVTPEPSQPPTESKVEPSAEATAATPPVSDTATTLEVSQVWVATHRVRAGGLDAREQADPTLPASAHLQPQVELQLAERAGDWAKVVGSNGWTGWVDARQLDDIGSPSPGASPPRSAGASQFPLGLVGAVVIAVGAFLPWVDTFGASINSFDISLPFLWDVAASGEPGLGYLVVGLAILGAAAALSPQVPSGLAKLAGLGAIAVTGVFVMQVNSGLSGPFSDVIDFLDLGVAATLVGGVLTFLAPAPK